MRSVGVMVFSVPRHSVSDVERDEVLSPDPHCECQLETERHVFAHCPRTADLRKKTADVLKSAVSGLLRYRSNLATKANVARLEWLVDHLCKDSRLWPNEECETTSESS